jgi:hypothetical protein
VTFLISCLLTSLIVVIWRWWHTLGRLSTAARQLKTARTFLEQAENYQRTLEGELLQVRKELGARHMERTVDAAKRAAGRSRVYS